MGARAIIFTALSTDSVLQGTYGIGVDRVWAAQAVDVVPRIGPFLILRWEEEESPFLEGAKKEVLTIWAHQARESSKDYAPLDKILQRVAVILVAMVDVKDADGAVACVDYNGTSPDFNDEGYKTICKYAGFKVVSR